VRQRSSSQEPVRGVRRPKPTSIGALDAALRLLGRRAHSRAELERKLSRRRHPPDEIDSALARLDELGYLDDSAFAAGLVRLRAASRGPRALSAELAQRGVGRAEAERALAGYDDALQLSSAVRIIERTYGDSPGLTYREMLNRVGSRLLRRGFSAVTVRAACRAVLSGTAGDVED
jgi:regulatory protein